MTLDIDLSKSKAVLWGYSTFKKEESNEEALNDLPAVDRSLTKLQTLLTDRQIMGLPPENIVMVDPTLSNAEALKLVAEACEDVEDTLILFYAGHGVLEGTEFFLATSESVRQRIEQTGISSGQFKGLIASQSCRARRKLVILDCCYAGKLIASQGDANSAIRSTIDVKDTYGSASGLFSVGAAGPTERARARPSDKYTTFSGALVHVLENGIANGNPTIDVDELFKEVKNEVARCGGPAPVTNDNNDLGSTRIARNRRNVLEQHGTRLDGLSKDVEQYALASETQKQEFSGSLLDLRKEIAGLEKSKEKQETENLHLRTRIRRLYGLLFGVVAALAVLLVILWFVGSFTKDFSPDQTAKLKNQLKGVFTKEQVDFLASRDKTHQEKLKPIADRLEALETRPLTDSEKQEILGLEPITSWTAISGQLVLKTTLDELGLSPKQRQAIDQLLAKQKASITNEFTEEFRRLETGAVPAELHAFLRERAAALGEEQLLHELSKLTFSDSVEDLVEPLANAQRLIEMGHEDSSDDLPSFLRFAVIFKEVCNKTLPLNVATEKLEKLSGSESFEGEQRKMMLSTVLGYVYFRRAAETGSWAAKSRFFDAISRIAPPDDAVELAEKYRIPVYARLSSIGQMGLARQKAYDLSSLINSKKSIADTSENGDSEDGDSNQTEIEKCRAELNRLFIDAYRILQEYESIDATSIGRYTRLNNAADYKVVLIHWHASRLLSTEDLSKITNKIHSYYDDSALGEDQDLMKLQNKEVSWLVRAATSDLIVSFKLGKELAIKEAHRTKAQLHSVVARVYEQRIDELRTETGGDSEIASLGDLKKVQINHCYESLGDWLEGQAISDYLDANQNPNEKLMIDAIEDDELLMAFLKTESWKTFQNAIRSHFKPKGNAP